MYIIYTEYSSLCKYLFISIVHILSYMIHINFIQTDIIYIVNVNNYYCNIGFSKKMYIILVYDFDLVTMMRIES